MCDFHWLFALTLHNCIPLLSLIPCINKFIEHRFTLLTLFWEEVLCVKQGFTVLVNLFQTPVENGGHYTVRNLMIATFCTLSQRKADVQMFCLCQSSDIKGLLNVHCYYKCLEI